VSRPALELADIFRRHGPAYRDAHPLPRDHLRLMRAIEICRTAELGGHVEECGQCSHIRISYNSCRNRHCPKCGSLERARWLEARKAELLPVAYFHVVFTIPAALGAIAWQNKAAVYDLLFRAAAQTLTTIARDPRHLGARIGFFAILHTWGQNLEHHPHLHCVVAGGGLSADGAHWISSRPGFFLPVRVLSRLFRRLFLRGLETLLRKEKLTFYGELAALASASGLARYLAPLRKSKWVVYAKPPFGGPEHVLEYLGRYTHRVALSNQRLTALSDTAVSFQWKDYRDGNRSKTMTLAADEFIRRFLLHALPPGFQRIRHYGWLSNRQRRTTVALCRRLLGAAGSDLLPRPREDFRELYEKLTGESLRRCPRCRIGLLVVTHIVQPGGNWLIRVDSS
jgi:hypothetical protein